jgi:hypothetical protein
LIFRYHEIKDQMSKEDDEDQEEEIKADEEQKEINIEFDYENIRVIINIRRNRADFDFFLCNFFQPIIRMMI